MTLSRVTPCMVVLIALSACSGPDWVPGQVYVDPNVADDPPVIDVTRATAQEIERLLTVPFYSRPDEEFRFARTYYVALNEPGASNDNDGLSPTYVGGRQGPFRDLNDERVRAVLVDQSDGVRMVLRAGTYRMRCLGTECDSGLVLRGRGDEFHPVVLTAYPGETAIIDGGERLPEERLRAIAAGRESYAIQIRQVVQLEGRYNIVENVHIRDGFRHNINVLDAKYTVIRNTTLVGAYEDSLKININADFGYIAGNDISGFVSQAIDHIGSNNWIVKRNDMHHPGPHPLDGRIVGNAITVKGGNANILIVGNRVHDFDTDVESKAAFAFGASGKREGLKKDAQHNLLPVRSAAVMENDITNFKGRAVQFIACHNCVAAGNRISNTFAAFAIGLLKGVRQGDREMDTLPPSRGTVIRANHVAINELACPWRADLLRLGMSCLVYFVYDEADAEGLLSEDNVYYADGPIPFVYTSDTFHFYSHDEFQRKTGTDRTSRTRPLAEFPR